MFFKRSQPVPPQKKDEPVTASIEKATVNVLVGAKQAERLAVEDLRRHVDEAALGFKTTDELEPITGLIGQDRALQAIEFGTEMRSHDFNIFVLGPPASGKRTAVTAQLQAAAVARPTPDDWIYVYNFEEPNRPKALRLPAGRARPFAKGMIDTLDELRTVVPALFEGDEYQARRRAIDAAFEANQEQAFEVLNTKAREQNIAILRTPQGFALAPTLDGKVIKPESFEMMPEEMRQEKQRQIAELEKELAEMLSKVPKSDKARRSQIAQLNEEIARRIVDSALDDLIASVADLPNVVQYLHDATKDLVRNIAIFVANPEEEAGASGIRPPADTARDPRFRRYMVNVFVAQPEGGAAAPVIEEINPVYGNLIGRIEHIAQMGTMVTDFLLMKPGALHRANGGTLILDARKLLLSPFAYEALKRSLKARDIRIEQPAESMLAMTTQSLDPEPIPLDVKVVLIGERELYYMLSEADPDFEGLFKVQADFDDSINRHNGNDLAYARVLASIAKQHGLAPVDASGVARTIEEGSRLAGDREKLSIEIGRISDLLREADYWRKKGGRATISRADVERAVDANIQRADRARDRSQEVIDRGVVLVDVDGSKVGQINGLAVLQLGRFAFGRPSRITARVRMGNGRVTDIEREAKLGGPLHTKGMMILWGYLAGKFALDIPLAVAATLVFEQSYGGVDGDSASSTELYALLSALSGVPIKQGLAVTGSVNQWGEVQAIGGVNEKIEGFFDTCKARGLSGNQGVLIPRSNVQHLMLREEVVQAVRDSKFSVYAVDTIDQGIELLTGVAAGDRGPGGEFPAGSINGLVEKQLREFADRAQKFGRKDTGNGDKPVTS